MGKKSKKAAEPKLSKKELRKLAEKAERKAAKGKKSEAERHPHLDHLARIAELDAIVNDPTAKKKARKAAQAELDQLRAEGQARIDAADKAKSKKGKKASKTESAAELVTPEQTADEIDAQIKARLNAKRAARDEALREMQADATAARTGRGEAAAKVEEGTAADAVEEPATDEPVESSAETPSPVDDFAAPSEAPRTDFETNGNRQYLVKRPSDGKMVGYTRVTTYIACLEDTAKLTEWKMRLLLEGVAAAETPDDGRVDPDPVTARIRDLAHRRDVAIAKARKQDRKGKLVVGQLATLVDGAMADFKRAMNELADELFELGGGRDAATKGTDIHALCDLYDAEGIAAIDAKLQAGDITPSDFADVEAYARTKKALGLEVVASEQVIVNDDLKVAGRLDRVYMAKLPKIVDGKGNVVYPGDTRRRRYIGDIKTGRVDYAQGKIAQQLRMYAESEAYDLDTHERSSHGANRTHGLLIHLPAGSGEAHVHLVDLATGAEGNKLAGQVRAFRNSGKRAFDTKIDLLAVAAAADEGSE